MTDILEMKSEVLIIAHLYKKVLFPHSNILFQSRLSVYKKLKAGDRILAFPVRSILDVLLYKNKIVTLAEIIEVNSENGNTIIQLKGITRVKLTKVKDIHYGMCSELKEVEIDGIERLRENLKKKAQELIFLINADESDKLIHLLNFIVNINQLTDFISNYFILKFQKRFYIFNELNVKKRADALIVILNRLINNLKIKREREQK